ncbi:MAG: serine/threonine-protein kinase [Myxococcota bacterium]
MDKYEVKKALGKVDQSGVFLATDKTTGTKVALKLFSSPSDAEREQLLKNAKILQGISHPNVVRILDVGLDDENNVFYAMEYLDGIPLHDLIPPEQGIGFEDSMPYIEKILAGLSAMHTAGVMHLDLKPGNILVVAGEPKIIDFGIIASKGQFRGTAGYVAPEIILGQKPTIKADIYSLGALLAFMWTGHKLFKGTSPENTMAHQLKNFSETIHQPELAGIVQRAIRQDPTIRYTDTAELRQALEFYRHEQQFRREEPSEDISENQWGQWMIAGFLVSLVGIALGIYYSLLTSV